LVYAWRASFRATGAQPAESVDGDAILIGEAKWGELDPAAWRARCEEMSPSLPFTQGRPVVAACWVGNPSRGSRGTVLTPDDVLRVLR
jgi:hypothetical protein